MKFTLSTVALVAIASSPLLVSALPASASLLRRDGVTCKAKYAGTMHVVDAKSGLRLSDAVTLAANDAHTLTVDASQSSLNGEQFQFDECFTMGWNAPPSSEYGQIKPLSLVNEVMCVTASPETDWEGVQTLDVRKCGDYNGGRLDRQWFYADYTQSEEGVATVTLLLHGGPNGEGDRNNVKVKTQMGISQAIGVTNLGTDRNLALSDVRILS